MSLTTVCEDALDAVVDYYTLNGIDLPARRYISGGQPAWDCELVAVYVVLITPGDLAGATTADASFEDGVSYGLRNATLGVTIVRCGVTSKVSAAGKVTAPTVAEEEAVAAALHLDADSIDIAILTSTLAGCQMLSPVGWGPIGPQGGFVGGEWRYRVSLEEGS